VDDAHQAGSGPASRIDDQILALWHGLRSNPSLDARWAMQTIDRLLDERPRAGQVRPGAVFPGLVPGSAAQEAVLAGILRAVLTGESG
jgi:hypothetical protein